MKGNSVSLHRIVKAKPEKVFRAFADPIAYANWLPPYGFLAQVHQMDFAPGGKFRMSFTNFSTGSEQAFGGEFVQIKTNELLQYTDSFDDPNLPGQMTTTIRLREVIGGTSLEIQQDGIPEAIPAEMCNLGWQESLEKLLKLVEPEIPDA